MATNSALNGVTATWDGSVCALAGTATANTFFNIFGSANSIPDGIVPGKKYRVLFERTDAKVLLQIRVIKDGVESATTFSVSGEHEYTVPDGITALWARYTVYAGNTVDGTATLEMMTAKTNAELESEIKAIEKYNAARNLLSASGDTSETRNGITMHINGDEYTIVGTATEPWYHIVAGDAKVVPDGIVGGRTYFANFQSAGKVLLRIYAFNSEYPGGLKILETASSAMFTMPDELTGVQIRLQVPTGVTADETVMLPYIGETLPNRRAVAPPEPMLTIIDDDGDVGFYNDILPIIEEKEVSIASAVSITRIGAAERWMTWDQIMDCYSRGAEILCHTYDHTHDGDDVAVEQVEHKYTMARNEMLKRGLTGANILVYSYSVFDKAKTAAERVFKCAFNSSGSVINKPFAVDRYNIARYGVETSPYLYDLTQLHALVDKLAADGGWMVWMVHTSSTAWTTYNAAQVIRDIIDYARSKNVTIASAEYGCKKYLDAFENYL